jgi:hypothetical protein
MKKILSNILIVLTLIGFFLPSQAAAQAVTQPTPTAPMGYCRTTTFPRGEGVPTTRESRTLERDCPTIATAERTQGWVPYSEVNPETPAESTSALYDQISCGVIVSGTLDGCLVKLFYWIFFNIPSFLLTLSANFFNVMISLTLGSGLYEKASFIPKAWGVVRDISNIFFILILLYAAIQMILGLGGHGSRKIIQQVIVMAVLINFSMFLVKVVIDTSNILALIFYNKIGVTTVIKNGVQTATRDYIPTIDGSKNGIQDKDISGGLVSAFDPSKLLSEEFFKKAKERTQSVGMSVAGTATFVAGGAYIGSAIPIPILGTAVGAGGGWVASKIIGYFISSNEVPPGLLMAIILICGVIMSLATYAFFFAGFAFLSRLIELWILIIFSPFAFMSSSLPILEKVPYIGWKQWLSRLFEVAFMAPIFMFFLYFIFMIVEAKIFQSLADRSFEKQGTIEAIILLIIPALVVIILLLKAISYAKKSSGELGQAVMSGVKVAGALAVGGAALGGAALARGTVRSQARFVQNDKARGDALQFKDLSTKWNKVKGSKNPFNYIGLAKTAITSTAKFLPAKGADLMVTRVPGGKDEHGNPITLGKKMQNADKSYSHIEHSKHEIEAKMKEMHVFGDDTKFTDLSEPEQDKVKKELDKDALAKYFFGNQKLSQLKSEERVEIEQRYDGSYGTAPGMPNVARRGIAGGIGEQRVVVDSHGDAMGVTDKGTDLSTHPSFGPDTKFSSDSVVDFSKANAALGEFVQALRKNTMDIRNLGDIKPRSKGFGAGSAVALAAVAAGLRLAMKKGGVEIGTSQKNFLQDLNVTITSALKSVKIDVSDVSKAISDHSKGGGHGGGGGHH